MPVMLPKVRQDQAVHVPTPLNKDKAKRHTLLDRRTVRNNDIMSDLKTKTINLADCQRRATAGMALTRKELSTVIGVPYQTVLKWKWVPVFEGRVFMDEFTAARRKVAGLEAVGLKVLRLSPPKPLRRRVSSAGIFD